MLANVLFDNVSMIGSGNDHIGFKGISINSFQFKNSDVSSFGIGLNLSNSIISNPVISNSVFTDCKTAVKGQSSKTINLYGLMIHNNIFIV